MSKFTQELLLCPSGDGNWEVRNVDPGLVWEVRRVSEFDDEVYEVEQEIHIPYGFITDLASVPKILWPIIASFGTHSTAAVLHDFLYRQADDHEWTRKWCDNQFYEAMLALETHKFRAKIMLAAVRVFGRRAFQRKAKQSI